VAAVLLEGRGEVSDQPAGVGDLERALNPDGLRVLAGGPDPVVVATCKLCRGAGRAEAFVCSACGGAGVVLVR
jgi:hypothetical protein